MGDVQVANLVTIKFSKSEPEAEEYTTHKARLFSTLFRLSIVTPQSSRHIHEAAET